MQNTTFKIIDAGSLNKFTFVIMAGDEVISTDENLYNSVEEAQEAINKLIEEQENLEVVENEAVTGMATGYMVDSNAPANEPITDSNVPTDDTSKSEESKI